jgi:hypothetical protein
VPAKAQTAEFEALIAKCAAAGAAAHAGAKPTPMFVGTPKDMMASLTGGNDGGFDPAEPVYKVNDGVCGFSWVTVYPATSAFARFCKSKGYGSRGYYGGLELKLWSFGAEPRMSQSYERGQAAAYAVAEVLCEAGFKAYAGGRLD